MSLSALTVYFVLASLLDVGFAFIGGFHCNFDNDNCGFTQRTDDNFDWTRKSGSTGSFDTGPSGDHTTGSGYYMYTEVSYKSAQDVAIMEKNDIPVCGVNKSLTFYYHMYGSDVGTLSVAFGNSTVFSVSGNQGNSWIDASIPLPLNGLYKLSFKGLHLQNADDFVGYKGDISIDDISIGSCAVTWFPAPSISVTEGDGHVQICMIREADPEGKVPGPLYVRVLVVGVTAVTNVDFTAPFNSTLMTFGIQEFSKCFNVTLLKDDAIVDITKNFSVTMENVTSNLFVDDTRNTMLVNILDDDQVTIGFTNTSLTVSEGDPYLSVCLTREGAVTRDLQSGLLSVRLSTIQGTAIKDQDFTTWFNSTSVIFGQREMSKCINVNLTDDDIVENSKTFSITMTNGSNVVRIKEGRQRLTVNITNDDKGVIQFEEEYEKQVEESLASGEVEMTCVVDRGTTIPLKIRFEVDNFTSTAIEGLDFTIENKTLTFQPGQTKVPVKINITRDGAPESTEILVLRMFSSDPLVDIGPNNTARVKINDKLDHDIQVQKRKTLEDKHAKKLKDLEDKHTKKLKDLEDKQAKKIKDLKDIQAEKLEDLEDEKDHFSLTFYVVLGLLIAFCLVTVIVLGVWCHGRIDIGLRGLFREGVGTFQQRLVAPTPVPRLQYKLWRRNLAGL